MNEQIYVTVTALVLVWVLIGVFSNAYIWYMAHRPIHVITLLDVLILAISGSIGGPIIPAIFFMLYSIIEFKATIVDILNTPIWSRK